MVTTYVALKALMEGYLTFIEQQKSNKINILKNLTKNNKISKKLILHQLSANSHTCAYDAIAYIGSLENLENLEVTLNLCSNLGLLRFSLLKIGWRTIFQSQLVASFRFEHF